MDSIPEDFSKALRIHLGIIATRLRFSTELFMFKHMFIHSPSIQPLPANMVSDCPVRWTQNLWVLTASLVQSLGAFFEGKVHR